jgi:hypothetical protein
MAKNRKKPLKRPTAAAIVASPQATVQFFSKLQSRFPTKPRTTAEKNRLRRYLAKNFNKRQLRGFMARALVSIVQHRLPPEVRRGRRRKNRNRGRGRHRR